MNHFGFTLEDKWEVYHLRRRACPSPSPGLAGIIGLLPPGAFDHVLPNDCAIHSTDSFSGRLFVRKSAKETELSEQRLLNLNQ